jgi:hypothetical protein
MGASYSARMLRRHSRVSSRVGLASLVVLLTHAHLAAAQGTPAPAPAVGADAATTEAARARFNRGMERLQQKAWDAALSEFVESRRILPTKSATQNMAVCLRELQRYDEALEALEGLLREFPNLSDDDRSAVARELADVRSHVGSIDVRTVDVGAQVIINGRARGTTPLSAPVRVSAGSHYVRVFKDGYAPFETRLQVAAEASLPVTVQLSPLRQSGRLAVTEQAGKSLEVVVDNVPVGKTPWAGQIDVGTHTVSLRGEERMGTQPAAVTVRLGEVSNLNLQAETLDAELRIQPTPANAVVALDGVTLGRGLWEGGVRRGVHDIEVTAEGFLVLRQKADVSAGAKKVVLATLERDPSSPLWRTIVPPAFFFELRLSGVLAPSLGGELNGGGLVFGGAALVDVGYRLGSGLGFSLQGGYATFGQSFDGRTATLTPQGLKANEGQAFDDLRFRTVILGLAGEVHRGGERFTYTARLGAGVMLGSLQDTRTGTFKNAELPVPTSYNVGPVSEQPDARYAYVAPTVEGFYRVSPNLELGLGLSALVGFALARASWSDQTQVLAGQCGAQERYPTCLGGASFGNEALGGNTLFLILPQLVGRYELR